MLRMAILILMVVCLYPFPAKSQTALATFMYLFVNDSIDVTHDYGNQFVIKNGFSDDARIKGRETVSIQRSCVFEVKVVNRPGLIGGSNS